MEHGQHVGTYVMETDPISNIQFRHECLVNLVVHATRGSPKNSVIARGTMGCVL